MVLKVDVCLLWDVSQVVVTNMALDRVSTQGSVDRIDLYNEEEVT